MRRKVLSLVIAPDKPAPAVARLLHEVESELSGELDESVVPRLGDNQNVLDIRAHPRASYSYLVSIFVNESKQTKS